MARIMIFWSGLFTGNIYWAYKAGNVVIAAVCFILGLALYIGADRRKEGD